MNKKYQKKSKTMTAYEWCQNNEQIVNFVNTCSPPELTLIYLLIDRLKKSKENNLISQVDFELAFNEASKIRISKIAGGYGEARYEMDDIDMQLWLVLADVWRKFGRLKGLIKRTLKYDDYKALSKLRSDLMDLSNFGLMGVQIIDYFNYIDRIKLKNKKGEDEK